MKITTFRNADTQNLQTYAALIKTNQFKDLSVAKFLETVNFRETIIRSYDIIFLIKNKDL